MPARSPVHRPADEEMAAHGVAQRHAPLRVPEIETIVECARVRVHELDVPAATAFGRLVDSRAWSGPRSQEPGRVGVHGVDVAEFQRIGCGTGDGDTLPRRSPIYRA